MKTIKKTPKSRSTIVLYIAAVVVLLIGITSLVFNINYYNNLVTTYVAQGYAASSVAAELLPSVLLPAIFQTFGLYFGIAFALYGIGTINNKVSVASLVKNDDCNTNDTNIASKDNEEPVNLTEINEEEDVQAEADKAQDEKPQNDNIEENK